MAANAFVFFVAAFETTSTTMAYCLLELAANPHVQDNMRQEILDALAQNHGTLTYDVIKNMQYMEKVISGKHFPLHLQILSTKFCLTTSFINVSNIYFNLFSNSLK